MNNSWYELMCISIDICQPGLPMRKEELDEIMNDGGIWFCPGAGKKFDTPAIVAGALDKMLIRIVDIQYVTHGFNSLVKWDVENCGFFEVFGETMNEIKPLYSLIMEEYNAEIAKREKNKDWLFIPRPLPIEERHHVRFSLPVLIYVWSRQDGYTGEVEHEFTVIKKVDLNFL